MNPAALMSRTCTITRRVNGDDVDDYGNPVPAESTITALCELQEASADEDTVDADRQVGDWNLFVAPTASSAGQTVVTSFDGSDTVTVDGVTYEVVGPPWPARNPLTQTLTHIQARVRRTV